LKINCSKVTVSATKSVFHIYLASGISSKALTKFLKSKIVGRKLGGIEKAASSVLKEVTSIQKKGRLIIIATKSIAR
jgi:hypothetical protein